ncbi:DNA polymerase zeta catalytic subunit isoform X3 [Euwallacea fornicatus]|uniref:DNA polymerase zeta catalytic subunit isoform X3 n=1 Tax=Euwallacea fornicatus TaxID=995702 RepID=UPI00338DDC6A
MPYSVKIVVLDYYMSAPTPGLDVIYSEFRSSTISQVPVIRCFGSLETGKKICVHIHGIFPYLYIPYDGKTNPEELMYKLAAAIDKTINIQFNQASSNTQHVYKISLVSGIPMYGYHAKKHQFLKIYLYNPSLVLKVGALLLNKHILAQVFQPHEVHLNFTLQFMIDYNLHGMSSMVMSDLKFRFNPEKPETGINKDLFLPHSIKKNSLCELEGDILAENILNKQEILSGNLAVNPGITTLWEDEKQRRRNKNQTSQLGCFLELKNINVAPTKTHLVYQQALKERLAILSTDNVIENESNPNVSIYPAETPSDLNIQSASLLDVHGSSSLELSLDETIISNNQNLDTTLTPNDVSLDQDAQSFLRILEQLAGEKIVEVEEEGCVLSQLPPLEHNEEIAEDDLDLSMPLESLTTPVKPYMNLDQYSHNSDENEDCFNTTLIPQIDGQYYSSDSDDENLTEENLDESMIAKATAPQQCNTKSTSLFYMAKELVSCPKKSPDKLSLSPYVLLPRCKLIVKLRRLDIEKYHSVNTNKLHLYHKPPPPSKMQETSAKIIRLLKFRVNQLTLKRKLLSIGKVIKRNSVAQLAHGLKPKFRVMSRNTQFLNIFKSASKRNINKTLPIRNMYVNCDGAVDSSSEDEQDISLKTKSMKKRPRSSLYPPLPISVMNTPSTAKCDSGPADNKLPISGYHKDCPSANQSVKVSYKRNLFSSQKTSSLNHTIVQEFISCTYSSESAHTTSPIPKQSCTPVQQTQTCRDVSQSCDPSHGESDLFSENENANEDNLTVSEKYDLNSKFHAKEGCSTIFTPDSSAPNSGHSLSSDIPPYQLHLTSIKNQPGKPQAPTRSRVEATLREYKIPKIQQQEPFYGNADDYTGFVEIGQRTLRIPSKTAVHLPDFESQYNAIEGFRKKFIESVAKLKWNANNVKSMKLAHCANKNVVLRPVKSAPSVRSVRNWVKNMSHYEESSPEPTPHEGRSKVFYIPNSPDNMNGDSDCELHLTPLTPLSPIIDQRKKRKKTINPAKNGSGNKSCQISGQTQNNTFGFEKSVQDLHAARVVEQHQYLTIMVMELHVRTRDDLKPDPQLDQIGAVFYSILNDIPEINKKKHKIRGVIAINNLPMELEKIRADFLYGLEIDCDITYVKTEEALINSVVELVRMWDADILTGYEIEMLSWGYLIERALVLSINLMSLLGRSELHKFGRSKLSHQEFETNIIGRIVLNVWRIMRHEIAVQSYTFESVVYHILHRRIPLYPFKDLTFWWDHHSNLYRHRTVRYYLLRVDIILELFHKLDFINRTSELARLFGIMFYEVLSRGSQFRVESMMLRLAKPLNFVPVSPDVKQRAHMKAPEFIPLVMEPESKMYTDPVIVLDFQSLYPSLIIAYNYCFTTCVGRVSNLGQNHPFEFGATQLNVPKKLIEKLSKRNLLNFSPCGVAFVKQKVREGILPRMLKEVLDTRLMVKNSMKENKGEDNLQKVLHNRQLGLKLIANVTYGYTAANFSGRMCCVEIGDSIVSKGRETLQRAIAVVEGSTEWEARVVYGDTDSLFVLVPGRTKEEAFEIGKQIADAVTADNPDPVKLKLEKVYQPCILQTKKRYVGYMYEGPDDTVPVYEAKGIETVRRDGCPAVSKMLQKCLKLLFETKDVSIIKNYVLKQFSKIQAGRASIQDLTFAKEYRGSSGYRPGACVPALELARKWTLTDKRNEPRSGERVPYIIVNGPPGLPLIRLVRTPKDLLSDSALRPNALYYITKVIIPPLNRCLNLIGADVNIWFNQMPRKSTRYLPNSSPNIKTTISQYFVSKMCACCSDPTMEGICVKCRQKPHLAALVLMEKLRKWEENYNNTLLMCNSCTGYLNQVNCESLDCPVLYRRTQTCNDLQQSAYVRELLETGTIFSKSSFFDSG